jgi:hypothetical protein
MAVNGEYTEVEEWFMLFLIWLLGGALCEYHAHPHVAHGLALCAGGHQHAVCRDCAVALKKDAEERRRNEYHERQERARWN